MSETLQDGDYYLDEKGLMVFTAQYLLRRGYCCKNGCRHCPYGFKKETDGEPASTPPADE